MFEDHYSNEIIHYALFATRVRFYLYLSKTFYIGLMIKLFEVDSIWK